MLKAAEQAKLTELMTPAGTLDRRLGPDEWFVPGEIYLQEDRLYWGYFDSNNKLGRSARPRDGLLEGFLALADAPGEKIFRYAKRWGVLMICDHMLPSSHNPNHLEIDQLGCRPLGWGREPYWEPLDAWRHFAGQAHALLRIANRVHQGKSADPADWERAYARSRQGPPNTQGSVWADRRVLTLCLDEWLHLADVRAKITWPDQQQRPTIRFGTFGVILSARGAVGACRCPRRRHGRLLSLQLRVHSRASSAQSRSAKLLPILPEGGRIEEVFVTGFPRTQPEGALAGQRLA